MPRARKSLICPSVFLSPPVNFLRLPPTFPRPPPLAQTKLPNPMLKHLLRSDMDFLLHIFNLSWTLHSFPSIWKTSFIIPIHKMGMPLLLPSGLSLSPPASQSFSNASFYPVFSSFWNLIPFSLSPPGRFPPWTVYSRSNFVSFSVNFG